MSEVNRTPGRAGSPGAGAHDGDPMSSRAIGTYAAVLLVEALVVGALWFFSRYFSA